mgnify:CR=1 FL=1
MRVAEKREGSSQGAGSMDDTPLMRELTRDHARRRQLEEVEFTSPEHTRIVTIANQKGGVGKTSTTVNLAAALTMGGLHVLVIDADPQGNTSTALNIEHHTEVPSMYEVLVESAPVTTLDGIGVLERVVSRAGAFPPGCYDEDLAARIEAIPTLSDEIDASGHLQISQEMVIAQQPDIVFGLPEPIFVVQVASVMALLFSPILFWLTIKAIKDNFTSDFEREHLPSKFQFAWAWAGTVSLVLLTLFVLFYQFLG